MCSAQGGATDVRVRAPDLRSADAWLNTDHPLSIHDLRGQVVLLDFWTYCCINCLHTLPDLAYLEEKYAAQPFVVIGVHSGKFDHEKDAQHIRQAILRHNISHPVAVDSDYEIWNEYAVRVWPTLVLIDPLGYVVGTLTGEGHREQLDRAIAQLLSEHRVRGTLTEPMEFKLERETFEPGFLQFPGKVLADARGDRLFISDTNHHRVIVTNLDGSVQHVIGTGEPGFRDGDYEHAEFKQPQGLELSEDGKTLFVADTENHALRAIDLRKRQVTTIAGTGEQARKIYRESSFGLKTELSSPWDLVRVKDKLFIAMAGPHQIWTYDLRNRRVRVHAGTGHEAATDGLNAKATFAQPSGLATDGEVVYVADSESSSIRSVAVRGFGRTDTVAGSGGLFDFGLKDGTGEMARFQHPLGVALRSDTLFVADTFNHAIRTIDLDTREVATWLGTGKPHRGTPARIGFFEPGGVSVADGKLYVADTNHHRIVEVDIATKRARVLPVGAANEHRTPTTSAEDAEHDSR